MPEENLPPSSPPRGWSQYTYPHQATPAIKRYPNNDLSKDYEHLLYIGTHFGFDVYVGVKGHDKGFMYCVFGEEGGEYYSGVGYGLTRTNRQEEWGGRYYLAAACALLNHPEHINSVLSAHRR